MNFSYIGPAGHVITITDDDHNSYSLTAGAAVRASVGVNDTVIFIIEIVADPSLTDSGLCADPYTLTIQ